MFTFKTEFHSKLLGYYDVIINRDCPIHTTQDFLHFLPQAADINAVVGTRMLKYKPFIHVIMHEIYY